MKKLDQITISFKYFDEKPSNDLIHASIKSKIKKLLLSHQDTIQSQMDGEAFFIAEDETILAGFFENNVFYLEAFHENITIL